jgi:hypothetical protein
MAASITMINPAQNETVFVGQSVTAYGTYQLAFKDLSLSDDKKSIRRTDVPTGDYIAYFLLADGDQLPTTFSQVIAVADGTWQLDLTFNEPDGTTKTLYVVLVVTQNPRDCPKQSAVLQFGAGAGIGLNVTPPPMMLVEKKDGPAVNKKQPLALSYHGHGQVNGLAGLGPIESIVVCDGVENKQDAKLKGDGEWEVKKNHDLKDFANRRVSHLVRAKTTGDPNHWHLVALQQLPVDHM